MSTLFYEKTTSFFASIESYLHTQTGDPATLSSLEADLEAARLALKSLRRLLVYGFPERIGKDFSCQTVADHEDAMRCFGHIVTSFSKFLDLRTFVIIHIP